MSLTQLPTLYAILDGATVRGAGLELLSAARSLRDAGIKLVQYRDKSAGLSEVLENANAIRSVFRGCKTTLVLNDWPAIAIRAQWDGVHVGQNDASVSDARYLVGDGRLVGISTHSPEQYRLALETDADYIAFGPIFGTLTKQNAEPPVGIEGLREVRKLSKRPLVAIGGISLAHVASVLDAGADSVAVVSALFSREQSVQSAASHLLRAAKASR